MLPTIVDRVFEAFWFSIILLANSNSFKGKRKRLIFLGFLKKETIGTKMQAAKIKYTVVGEKTIFLMYVKAQIKIKKLTDIINTRGNLEKNEYDNVWFLRSNSTISRSA